MKIVDSGYKIDLHIHSECSRVKDKAKVAFNTIENIGTLAEKLSGNGVQMCAITDHDVFSYDMYRALKAYEADAQFSIIKVLPGVEFSVEFQGDNGKTVIHVIAIFSDADDEKVRNIATLLPADDKKVDYDCDAAFSEKKFLEILRDIGIDTILIAHQKSTLTSLRPYKNDARTAGDEKFNEFIYTDYFEAFEFKNRKNEVFNKSFLTDNKLTEDIRFITGSDCHDWRYYPRVNEKDTSDFIYTYVKCLPSFRGLVMAITDHRRIKTVNSFFNVAETYIQEIELSINGVDYHIPLSRGINVIIGDNSIGKSLLLHKMTGYGKKQGGLLNDSVTKGYDKYIRQNNIEIKTEISDAEIFAFDMQGEVRYKFESGKTKSDEFLKRYFPEEIQTKSYKEKIQRKLNRIYGYLEEKFAIELQEAQLGKFQIVEEEPFQAESLTFVGSVDQNIGLVAGLDKVCADIDEVVEKLRTLMEDPWLEQEDKNSIDHITGQLDSISMKYGKQKKAAELENIKIGLFTSVMDTFRQRYQSSISDSQKKLSTYNENISDAANTITSLILRRKVNIKPDFSITTETIEPRSNSIYKYEFVSKLGITQIDTDYISGLFAGLFKKDTPKELLDMTQRELAEYLLRYNDSPEGVMEELKSRISGRVEDSLKNIFLITQAGADRTQELSAGFNSKIYFDILSYERSHDGVYIIDQPEDNVSQKSIREYLLDRFKVMGENRQILIVTHNPQFIVNLDVDNVIYIGKEDDTLIVRSGALEYRDDIYNILDIVSEHIEGGLDTLKRRWKRYEKSSAV